MIKLLIEQQHICTADPSCVVWERRSVFSGSCCSTALSYLPTNTTAFIFRRCDRKHVCVGVRVSFFCKLSLSLISSRHRWLEDVARAFRWSYFFRFSGAFVAVLTVTMNEKCLKCSFSDSDRACGRRKERRREGENENELYLKAVFEWRIPKYNIFCSHWQW